MDIIQIIITLIIFVLLVIPMGKYLYKVISKEKCFVDPVFDKIDNLIFKCCSIDSEEMSWKKYAASLLITNLVMALICFLILLIQGIHLLNPNGIKGMNIGLAFNTAISFITNTNLQNYSGEAGASYLSQMAVMTYLMFTSAATGFSVAAGFMRGIIGKKKTIGNYYVDLVRVITRVLLPISLIIAVVLISQGVPQTLSTNVTVNTIEGKLQDIALGPVASLEAIKQLGTNGGGFFGANSAHPFENPNPFTNLIEILSMMLLSGSIVYAFGLMVKNKKQGWTIFIAMSVLFLITLPVCYHAEHVGNPNLAAIGLSQAAGNMEGKEVRFGIAESSLFTSVTTAFTTGAVNTSIDSLTPLGNFVPMWNMMLNVAFGGKGVGFIGMIMYAILTVFICGLMVGRTPEFLSKKIEGKEIKLIASAILIHPLIILMPTAFTLISKSGLSSITNPGFHGLSQVLYMFTTSAANNGSSMQGLASTTTFWNISTGFIMILGRYVSIILLLAVAGSLSSKRTVPETSGTFRTDNSTFIAMLIFIVLIIGALTFLPALMLGPVAEHLTLKR